MDKNILLKICGSFITGLAFVCFVLYAYLFFNLNVGVSELLLAFFIGFAGYSSLRFLKHRVTKYLFMAMGIFLMYWMYLLFSVEANRLLVLILNGLIWVFYHSFFRKRIVLKPLIIAFSWISWLYFFTQKLDVWFYVQQFLLIFFLTLPFDIGGMEKDKIPTIPKKYGVKNTLRITRIFLLLYALTGFALPYEYCINTLVIFLLINILLLFESTFKVFYVYLCYDGIIAVQTLVLLLVKEFISH